MASKKIRHEVFCSYKILEQYFEQYPKLRDSEIDEERAIAEAWRILLFRNSDLAIDISEEDAITYFKENNIFKFLVKASQGGGSRLTYDKEFFDCYVKNNSYTEFTSPLFIIDNSNEECQEIEDSYGVLAFNFEKMFKNSYHIFNPINKFITKSSNKKDNINTWNDLSDLKHTCNSMIIIDNYLLDNENDIINNVIPMLDALMPQKLDKEKFHLRIITWFDDNKDKNIKKKRYDKIQECIKDKLKRSYEIVLSILFHTKEDVIHDRDIITNYMWFNSGHSFTYFRNGKAIRNTTLKCCPVFCQNPDSIENDVQLILENLKQIKEDDYEIIGENKNRLLNKSFN